MHGINFETIQIKDRALTDLEIRDSKGDEFLCVSKMSTYYTLFLSSYHAY